MRTVVPLDEKSLNVLHKLEGMWEYAGKAVEGRTIKWKSDLRRIILMQMSGAFYRIIRAMLSEIRGGSVDGLDTHVRSIVEGLINLKYILDDDTQMRARAYIADDNRDRIIALKRLISLLENETAPGMATVTDANRYKKLKAQLEKELSETEARYGAKNMRWPSLAERARLSNMEESYASAFWLLSLDTHLTARGLDRFMREGEEDNFIMEMGQDLSRVYMHLRTAHGAYLDVLVECGKTLGIPSLKELERFKLDQN